MLTKGGSRRVLPRRAASLASQQPGENVGGEESGEGKADSIYKVSTSEELVSAQEAIAAAEGTEATIVLKADVTVSGGVLSKQLWR